MSEKKKDEKLYNKNFIQACSNAINGIVYSATTQSNIKKELILGALVMILSLFFDYSPAEFLSLTFAVFFVLFAEMINTAIETVVDLYIDVYHPKAKIAKDVAAGAVLLASVNAVIVGYFLMVRQVTILKLNNSVLNIMISSPYHLAFVAMMLTAVSIIGVKAYIERERIRTGIAPRFIPSGQSTATFALLTIIWLNSKNPIVICSALVLSILVLGNRLHDKRTIGEVLFGAFMGVLVALMTYSLLFIKLIA